MIAFELLKGHLADALNEMFVDNVCYSLTGGNYGLAYTSEACIFVIHFSYKISSRCNVKLRYARFKHLDWLKIFETANQGGVHFALN